MTTTTTALNLADYATVIAIEDNASNGMVIADIGTSNPAVVADTDYAQFKFVISDQSEALDTYRDNATDSDKDTAKEYTDGYAVVASAIMHKQLWESGAVLASTDTDTTMTNELCLTGTIATADNGTDADIAFTSCASATVTCTNTASTPDAMSCTFASTQGVYAAVNEPVNRTDPANTTWTPVSAATGFSGSWIWTGYTDSTDITAVSTTTATMKVGRFFPKLEKKEYSATDLRFDGLVAGHVGYSLNGADYVWDSAAWKSAVQVASVAAAAAVVALTF